MDESAGERLRRIGELARIMTDAGMIFITTVDEADDLDIRTLKLLNEPNEILVVNVGKDNFTHYRPDLTVAADENVDEAVNLVADLLISKEIIMEYQI